MEEQFEIGRVHKATKDTELYATEPEEKDPFWFCEIDGCEAARKDCIKTCPYGKESGCPPLRREPTDKYVEQCRKCGRHCTKEVTKEF